MSRSRKDRGPSSPGRPTGGPPPRRAGIPRRAAFLAAVGVVGVAVVVAIVVAGTSGGDDGTATPTSAPRPEPSALQRLTSAPHVVFRNTETGRAFGRVAVVDLADPGGPRALAPLSCERIAFDADRGVCLYAERGGETRYRARIFDGRFRVLGQFDLAGLPSRARVSPDGRYAAMTVFTSGDCNTPTFTTRTTFTDLRTGEQIGSLDQFEVTHGGRVVDDPERNYWGVTFAPDSRGFYATLQTGGATYMIHGDLSARTAEVVREGVVNPSMSPDGTRIAYMARIGDSAGARWRIHVLDLRTGADNAVAGDRDVDDQVEWLDDETILYARPRSATNTAVNDVWRVPADGSGKPEVLVAGAWSPSVVR